MVQLIEIEGIDASGKSTLAKNLTEHLKSTGARVLHIAFPDHTSPTGKVLRAWLAREWTTNDPDVDALLFQCAQIVNRLDLLPRESEFEVYDYIIVDRYYTSGLVYGSCDGLDLTWLISVQERLPKPDISIHMRVPVEESFRRKGKGDRDRYEEDQTYIQQIAWRYEEVFSVLKMRDYKTRYFEIDGTQARDAVLSEVIQIVVGG